LTRFCRSGVRSRRSVGGEVRAVGVTRDDLTATVMRHGAYDQLLSASIAFLASRGEEIAVHWHPLGFIDIPVSRNTTDRTTIHVWHPRFRRRQEPPELCHSHGWTLWSTVLAGTVENHTFEVTESAVPTGAVLYVVDYVGPTSVALRTSHYVIPELVNTESVLWGRQYSIAADTYHSTSNPPHITITVMHSDLRNAASSRVIWPPATKEPEFRYERQACSPETTKQVIADVLTALGQRRRVARGNLTPGPSQNRT
jgi:hypothetical protein